LSIELKGLKNLGIVDELLTESVQHTASNKNFYEIPLDKLIPGSFQPRNHFDDYSLNELANSIIANGILQPLLVRQLEDELYEILAGERRWRAAKIAGLIKVPVLIKNVNDETALAFGLIENIQRQNLNPIEEASALNRLKNEFNMTHDEISKRIGRSRSAVTNLLRLLLLHEDVKALINENQLEMGHARTLLILDHENQADVARVIVSNGLSVRDTEKLVRKVKSQKSGLDNKSLSDNNYQETKYFEEVLSKLLGINVEVSINIKSKSNIKVQVNNVDELQFIVSRIKGIINDLQ
jgi:ParB family chromosome partitioning protein